MTKSAINWLAVIKTGGKKEWNDFYKAMLGRSISDPERFHNAVERLGTSVVFEAIVSTSTKTFKEDCLNYVLAVASRMVNAEVEEITYAERYRMNLERSKERVRLQNESLEIKIEQAKERSREQVTD